MNFGEKLKQLRQQQSWTQPEAAEAIGIEQSYLSKLENDKSQPSAEVFQQVLQAFKISVADLLEDLSAQGQRQLKAIPEVAEHFADIKKGTIKQYRSWLISGFVLFGIGALLFAMGYFKTIVEKYQYTYYSEGVVKEGERATIFNDYDEYVSLLSGKEFRQLKKDLLERRAPLIKTIEIDRNRSFIEEVEGGKRLFEARGIRKQISNHNN